ncbi:MAG TPA: hypothetical protein VF046_04440 [Gemmatimonadales bacterium]
MSLPPLDLSVVAVLVLAAVHVITPSLRFIRGIPRSIWLSIFGGVSVAYVFVHLLPELAEGQERLGRALASGVLGVSFAERHVYLVALFGLAVFYGLERLAKRARSTTDGGTGTSVFWIHMGSFGIYNAVVGYLLVRRPSSSLASLVFFTVAMALHFVVTDYGLTEDHEQAFPRIGRWVLAGAVLAGYVLGLAFELPQPAIDILIAFLAGGVILNVLKEEVPAERQSRFWAFAAGAAGYAFLLLFV